jgi:hypothetical protein
VGPRAKGHSRIHMNLRYASGVNEWPQLPDFDSGYVGSNPTAVAKIRL